MTDRLILSNMLFYGYHGALPEEAVLGQRFSVSLELEVDTRPAAECDDLSRALNYAAVCEVVKNIVEGPPCKLLETVAEKIASAVLAMGAVSVLVTVKKLHPPVAIQMDYAAVQIKRKNKKNRPPCFGPPCFGFERAYLSLGSNLGDRARMLSFAVEALAATPGIMVRQVAAVRETDPVGYLEQGKFLNTVVEIDTTLSPRELLLAVQRIEEAAGRVRDIRFGPRTLDIDILLYGNKVISEEGLVIPHPRMREREFVLVPFIEIAPHAIVPPDNITIEELCARVLGKEV
ncbi:MAG: 2-amino-4-hydroxy-6-hydroxymethyldihydropteridine diphosphokinase [Selenomonadales bacterium]|nr:2-amino-4-hydroxy-6-hydroxymethyldihydropteridine diphosphokinase [Selenomonadales bacterium]